MRSRGGTTTLALTAALTVMSLGTTALAQPAALNQAPQGADLVVYIPNLQQLSGDIAELRQTLNLPMPEMDDALGAFKQATGMNAGVDDAGSMLIVLPDLGDALAADREPQAVLIVPVNDYDAFVKAFEGTEGPVSTITMPDGQAGFVKKLGGFAVMGESQEMVAAYQPGNAAGAMAAKIGTLGQRYLASADAVVYLDLDELRPAVLPALREGMEAMLAMAPPDPQTQAVWTLYGSAAETFITDAHGLLVSLDLGAGGIGITYAVAYDEGSTLAKFFPGSANAAPALLSSLPSKPFLFASSFDARAIDLQRLYDAMLGAMPEEDGNALREMSQKWQPLMKDFQGGAMAFYAPGMNMMGNFFNTATVMQVRDADAYVTGMKGYIQGINGMELPTAMPGHDPEAPAPVISYTTAYNDNVLQLEGLRVDQYQVTTNFPPEMMQEMGPAAGFAQMFASYQGYLTAKGDKVVMTTVLDPQLVTSTLQQLDAGGGIGAAGAVARIRDDAMPPNPVAEVYIGVDGIAETASMFMQMMMGAQPLVVPADLAPISGGLAIQDQGMAFRWYLPTDTVKYIIDTGMSLQQQFGGMGGPGSGPGGPPPF